MDQVFHLVVFKVQNLTFHGVKKLTKLYYYMVGFFFCYVYYLNEYINVNFAKVSQGQLPKAKVTIENVAK